MLGYIIATRLAVSVICSVQNLGTLQGQGEVEKQAGLVVNRLRLQGKTVSKR